MSDPFVHAEPAQVGMNAQALDGMQGYFRPYLDDGKLASMGLLVARRGKVAHLSFAQGTLHEDTHPDAGPETIYRIYSMTKPVTSVALMMLVEEAKLHLYDPVAKFIPAFGDMSVFTGGTAEAPETRPAEGLITIKDLMTHTSGLTYSFLEQHPVDEMYRLGKIDPFASPFDLEGFVNGAAALPLLFDPGQGWNYSIATDVIGRVIEVVTGQTLDTFFRERIFAPLGMEDTGFSVPEEKLDRFAPCFRKDPRTGETVLFDPGGKNSMFFAKPPKLYGGGGGLVSTMADYYRFCEMIAGRGTRNGQRLLSPKTLSYMMQNHLPGRRTIKEMGDQTFSESRMDGSGFGLGFAVNQDPVEAMQVGSPDTCSWGGLASTFFWIDPVEELIAIQLTQLIPSSTYPMRPQMQALVYGALDD